MSNVIGKIGNHKLVKGVHGAVYAVELTEDELKESTLPELETKTKVSNKKKESTVTELETKPKV